MRARADAPSAARDAATYVARLARRAISGRGVFHLAVSGGSTPALLLRALASRSVDWASVHVWQVDERVAPDGDNARNAVMLQRELVARAPIPTANVHLMDVTARDLADAARRYAAALPAFDLVHLGLGDDGHTASWPPDQPAVRIAPGLVTTTAGYRGVRRMTLTADAVRQARHVLWLVCGPDKREALRRVLDGDTTLPATHAVDERSVFFVDRAADPLS